MNVHDKQFSVMASIESQIKERADGTYTVSHLVVPLWFVLATAISILTSMNILSRQTAVYLMAILLVFSIPVFGYWIITKYRHYRTGLSFIRRMRKGNHI